MAFTYGGYLARCIPMLILMAVVWWSYYAFVVELCIYTIKSTIEKVVYLVIYHMIFMMFFWSYWRTIVTLPAIPSKQFCLSKSDMKRYKKEDRKEIRQEILKRAAKDLPIVTRTRTNGIRYCNDCKVIPPDRCYHCSICERCVLKRDHHCPWVNNCIGFANYKFFLLFLLYASLYCLFVASTVLQYCIKFWMKYPLDAHAKSHVLALFFVGVVFFIFVFSLFYFHCRLVGKNRSTYEVQFTPCFETGAEKDGFYLGFSRNFREVFGDQKLLWLLPVFTSLGNGEAFPTRIVSGDPEQNAGMNQDDIPKHSGST
ncbi:palmitoyltransferase ZDHHC20-A-like [Spea bombifrons]|uniref:palmitoyltransferase ZDHHC20-A-like n=1 Tax=Spea bombifrons TaxID=233779 RepID=UPI00234AE5D3|nr:palmitoyltransferase ZDHHC20-A-like [Spea bombifrons]